jgi:transcriptional regulator with XRE-family HTH domain
MTLKTKEEPKTVTAHTAQDPTLCRTADGKLDIAQINRSQMARETGVDLAHISRILSGQSNPSLKLAVKIAMYLGVTLDVLTTELNEVKEKAEKAKGKEKATKRKTN